MSFAVWFVIAIVLAAGLLTVGSGYVPLWPKPPTDDPTDPDDEDEETDDRPA